VTAHGRIQVEVDARSLGKVLVDGHELSDYIRAAILEMRVGEMPILHLELAPGLRADVTTQEAYLKVIKPTLEDQGSDNWLVQILNDALSDLRAGNALPTTISEVENAIDLLSAQESDLELPDE
jgi:hypothetical protein